MNKQKVSIKHINEQFTTSEYNKLLEKKNALKLNWHDFIMLLVKNG